MEELVHALNEINLQLKGTCETYIGKKLADIDDHFDQLIKNMVINEKILEETTFQGSIDNMFVHDDDSKDRRLRQAAKDAAFASLQITKLLNERLTGMKWQIHILPTIPNKGLYLNISATPKNLNFN